MSLCKGDELEYQLELGQIICFYVKALLQV
jgi:hypothetical protein